MKYRNFFNRKLHRTFVQRIPNIQCIYEKSLLVRKYEVSTNLLPLLEKQKIDECFQKVFVIFECDKGYLDFLSRSEKRLLYSVAASTYEIVSPRIPKINCFSSIQKGENHIKRCECIHSIALQGEKCKTYTTIWILLQYYAASISYTMTKFILRTTSMELKQECCFKVLNIFS